MATSNPTARNDAVATVFPRAIDTLNKTKFGFPTSNSSPTNLVAKLSNHVQNRRLIKIKGGKKKVIGIFFR